MTAQQPDTIHPKRGNQVLATIGANLGSCALGTAVGWSSPAHKLLKERLNVAEDTSLALAASIVLLGAAMAQFLVVITAKMRRKLVMQAACLPFICGWIVILFAESVHVISIGRFITGFFGGVFCIVAPTYVGEIADKDIRGRLGECYEVFSCLGQLTPFLLGDFKDFYLLTIPLISIPIAGFAITLCLPESPVYYLSKENTVEATKSLQFFRGKDYNIADEIEQLKEYAFPVHHLTFLKDFTTKASLRGFFILMGLHLIQQLTGIKALMFFAHPIFEMAGSRAGPELNAIILMIMKLTFTFVSLALVDRLGRRCLMMFSLAIDCVSLFLVGLFFTLQVSNPDSVKHHKWMPLTFCCTYIAGFSIGTGPIPYAILSELLPPTVKVYAGPAISWVNWMTAFAVTKSFPYVNAHLGTNFAFFVFSCVCAIGVIFVYFCLIETKGKSLEEIQLELEG